MGFAVRFPLMHKPARDLEATFAPSASPALLYAAALGTSMLAVSAV